MFFRRKQCPPPIDPSDGSPPDNNNLASPNQKMSPIPEHQPTEPKTQPPCERDLDRPSTSQTSRQSRQLNKKPSWCGSFPRVGKSTTSPAIINDTVVGGTLRSQASTDFRHEETASLRSTATENAHDQAAQTRGLEVASGKQNTSSKASSIKSFVGGNNKQAKREAKSDCKTDSKSAKTKFKAPPPISIPQPNDNRDDDSNSITDTILSPPMPSTPVRPPTPVGWLEWLGWGGEEPPTASYEGEKPDGSLESDLQRPSENEESEASKKSDSAALDTAQSEEPQVNGWIEYLWSAVPTYTIYGPGPTEPESGNNKEAPATPTEELSDQDPVIITKATSPAAGSTWAFWSRDTGVNSSGASSTSKEPGEIAVIGDTSESHPAPANRGEIDPSAAKGKTSQTKKPDVQSKTPENDKDEATDDADNGAKSDAVKANDSKPLSGKAKRTKQVEAIDIPRSRTPVAQSTTNTTKQFTVGSAPTSEAAVSSPVTTGPPNLLLPSFDSTYSMRNNPSITRQLGRLLLRSTPIPLHATQLANPAHSPNQIFKSKRAPKIRRAVAIGVHGLFPHTYLRAMIGQPTGTSLRFASLCAESIRRWADANGSPDCEIEKVALEGEGKIAERVDNLWKLLMNWVDHLRQADVIILACHSQGVPVGIMLLSKLIQLKIITTARIGVCAMAGVSQGPFPYRTASMLGGSAAELLEFANPASVVAQNYEHALREVLEYGGRVTYIGSIDDQLVPLESAIHSPLHHPYVYRAVFVDSRIHAPDFLAHLVGFALKLRNLGISDHGLIRELSSPLAGSLYTGEGHSRLYFDSQVYDLAIQHSLETTDVPPYTEPEFRRPMSGTVGVANTNPYHLPWIMRGLLEEGRVKSELSEETAALLQMFDDWNPATAKLKEVKYKLEAIKSNL